MVRDGRGTSSFQVSSDALRDVTGWRAEGCWGSLARWMRHFRFQGLQACSALSGLSHPALLKPREEYAVVITTLPEWTLRLRELKSLHQAAQLVSVAAGICTQGVQSQSSPSLRCLRLESWSQARPPLRGLTEREGRCFLLIPFQPQPPNSVGIISQMFLGSASSLCPEPRSLRWLGLRACPTGPMRLAPLGS